MLSVIRHSEDDTESTYAHDGQLTRRGRELARMKGKSLIARYGEPTAIYCSPFRRTKETLKQMYPMEGKATVIVTPELSRYFSSRERKDPRIADETRKLKAPTTEDYRLFRKRVLKFTLKVYQQLHAGDIVWFITHSTVYKQISRLFGVRIPLYIEPTDSFTIIHSGKYGNYCEKCQKFHSRWK